MIIESLKRAKRRFMSDIWRRLGALALAIYVWTWINVRVTDRHRGHCNAMMVIAITSAIVQACINIFRLSFHR